MQSVIEITTPVCRSAAEVERAAAAAAPLRRRASRASEGCRFASAGTHPFSLFERQRITAKDRYRQARRPDAVHRAARADLRHAHPRRGRQPRQGDPGRERARSCTCRSSSRCRRARRSGAASRPASPRRGRWSSRRSRARACRRASTSYEEFAELVGQLERTGCIADYTHIWWDIRAARAARDGRAADLRRGHARRGRRRDHGLLPVARQDALRAVEARATAPSFHRILTTENKWLAARHGLQAPVMDLVTGRRNRVPIAELVRRTMRDLEPHARELGCERGARRDRGDPLARQRRRAAAAHLEREPRHRRGRRGSRRCDRGRRGALGSASDERPGRRQPRPPAAGSASLLPTRDHRARVPRGRGPLPLGLDLVLHLQDRPRPVRGDLDRRRRPADDLRPPRRARRRPARGRPAREDGGVRRGEDLRARGDRRPRGGHRDDDEREPRLRPVLADLRPDRVRRRPS